MVLEFFIDESARILLISQLKTFSGQSICDKDQRMVHILSIGQYLSSEEVSSILLNNFSFDLLHAFKARSHLFLLYNADNSVVQVFSRTKDFALTCWFGKICCSTVLRLSQTYG